MIELIKDFKFTMIIPIIGIAFQAKTTYDAYMMHNTEVSKVESTFSQSYREYLELKNKVLSSIEKANKCYIERDKDLFKLNVENAEYDYRSMCHKLSFIKKKLYYIIDDRPIQRKLLSLLSFVTSIGCFIYSYFGNQPESTLQSEAKSQINIQSGFRTLIQGLTATLIFSIGIVGLHFTISKSSINSKLDVLRTESLDISVNLKNKIDMLNRKAF